MTGLFGLSIDTLTTVLVIITALIIAGVAILALTNPIFFKIGVRNIPRRRTQMLLIVFALMLSTTLLSSMLASGDVINAAVQSVAVYNLGQVDETISGGHGDLGYFPDGIYYRLSRRFNDDPNIQAMAAALVEHNLLVADYTSRQVRSKVTALAILPGSETHFSGMLDDRNQKTRWLISQLGPNEIYLNHTAAILLNAHAGDNIYLYSQRWSGKRYPMHVKAIVTDGGLIGQSPYVLSPLRTFQLIENHTDDINQIFVANTGKPNDPAIADLVSSLFRDNLPRDVRVDQVKQSGVQFSQKAQEIFVRIFGLFALFALAIGLLLIFLIFVLLAAERRVEMGMARAIGVQRRHLILMFLFEGFVYDLGASAVGLAVGIGLGAVGVLLLGPILARFGFPLSLTLQTHSLVIAYCLGVIFTFVSVLLSSFVISRMTIVDAIRNLAEQRRSYTLGELILQVFGLIRLGFLAIFLRRLHRASQLLIGQLPEMLARLLFTLISLGFLPLLLGYWLMQFGLENAQIAAFSLGLSAILLGAGLLIRSIAELLVSWFYRGSNNIGRFYRARRRIEGLFAALVGIALCAYWALPFDVLAQFGLPRFTGGIEIFFVAGIMMVLGTVWALVANAEFLLRPLLALNAGFSTFNVLTRLASSYPLHQRLRTALSIIMFSLVVFAMTVMAVITNAMQNTYVDINTQTGGYDIQATAYFKSLPDLHTALTKNGINPADFSAIGISTSTAVGIIQPSASAPEWQIYPAQVISGSFLNGMGVHLTARAKGFASDAAVFKALQTHPDYALIDSNALPFKPAVVNAEVNDPNVPLPADIGASNLPPGYDSSNTYAMSGVYQGDTNFPATPVWITDTQLESSTKVTVIGVVDNSDQSHFGLYIPSGASTQLQRDAVGQSPEAQTYYFKVAPGQDKRALAQALGSAFLDNGLETTVLEDEIWQVRGPRILLSQVLLGVVGLTLLLGIAALAITGTRAVVERKQQIGMLRAIGCGQRLIQGAFLLESFLVGCLGSVLGVVLGLILSSNIFAANFFEKYQTGLVFTVPWDQLGLIVGVALLASLLAALLPAWQSGRISPSEVLRQP